MQSVISYITGLGASVVLPVVIFLMALILGQKPGKAIRAGVTIGVGFIGINLVIGLLMGALGPAAQSMVTRTGIHLSYIDVGWPAASAISFGTQVGALAIPVGLAVNILWLAIGMTKTLDIDLWNYWHLAFAGSIVGVISHSYALGVAVMAIDMVLLLALADWSAPWVQDYYKFPNISLPHGFSAPGVLWALPFNWVFDRVPGLRKWKADPETIEKRFGVLGNSMIVGLILGAIIGLAAYDPGNVGDYVKNVATLAMSMAAVMLILPRMVAILMEGLIPVSEAAGKFVKARFPGRDFYIGLDSAIAVGSPAVIASSLVLIPITLALALVLPGNRVLPFGDLATIPFMVAMMVPIFRGNVVRTIITGAVAMAAGLYIATWIAPTVTIAAQSVGFTFPAGATTITALSDPATWTTLGFALVGYASWLGAAVATVVVLGFSLWVRQRRTMTSKAPDVTTPTPLRAAA